MTKPFAVWFLETLLTSPFTKPEEKPLVQKLLDTAQEAQHARLFEPTHYHIRSGRRYQVLGEVQLRPQHDDGWLAGVLYRDADNQRYVRAKLDFEAAFQEVRR